MSTLAPWQRDLDERLKRLKARRQEAMRLAIEAYAPGFNERREVETNPTRQSPSDDGRRSREVNSDAE